MIKNEVCLLPVCSFGISVHTGRTAKLFHVVLVPNSIKLVSVQKCSCIRSINTKEKEYICNSNNNEYSTVFISSISFSLFLHLHLPPFFLLFFYSISSSLHKPLALADWLTVCCVYFGIQGDVGPSGPSGSPGDQSLSGETIVTTYKGNKVTQRGKG